MALAGPSLSAPDAPQPVRDAASLILLDRDRRAVLMGRRSMRHVFMPGVFVFPGGRVDRGDARVDVAAPLEPRTEAKLLAGTRRGAARARALGVAAVREAWEETGVVVGRPGSRPPRAAPFRAFAAAGVEIDLSPLRFLMRAVTPPGRTRRFDARFFVVGAEHVVLTDPSHLGGDAELEDVAWLPLAETDGAPLASITRAVLAELVRRLAVDPGLSPDAPVPYLRSRRGAAVAEAL